MVIIVYTQLWSGTHIYICIRNKFLLDVMRSFGLGGLLRGGRRDRDSTRGGGAGLGGLLAGGLIGSVLASQANQGKEPNSQDPRINHYMQFACCICICFISFRRWIILHAWWLCALQYHHHIKIMEEPKWCLLWILTHFPWPVTLFKHPKWKTHTSVKQLNEQY